MENLNLIRKIAHHFHQTTKVDFHECFSEASLAYMEAKRTFDPTRGNKFSTYAFKVMKNNLIDFCKKETYVNSHFVKILDNDSAEYAMLDCISVSPVDITEGISSFVENLPEDCKRMAAVIFSHLDEIPSNMPPKLARGKVAQILRAEGWGWPTIKSSIRHMKLALK